MLARATLRRTPGYPRQVAQALEQWNITTATVGSLVAGPASSPAAWRRHEGHPGWTIEQVASISSQWLETRPDVITIHLGTNDAHTPPASAVAALRALLKTIGAGLPSARVFVASILRIAGRAPFVTTFNAAVPGVVRAAVRTSTRALGHFNPQPHPTVSGTGDASLQGRLSMYLRVAWAHSFARLRASLSLPRRAGTSTTCRCTRTRRWCAATTRTST